MATKLSLLAAGSLTVMAGATIAPALPAIQEHFGEEPHAAVLTRLVLTAPALFIALSSPLAGYLSDWYGRRPLLLSSVALYGLAGTSGYVAPGLWSILTGRALLGVAVAGVMTAATTLAADYYAGEARGRFMGLQSAFMSFGGVAFLASGGLLADLGWRTPFLIYLSALALLPLAAYAVAEPRRARHTPGAQLAPGGEAATESPGTPYRLLAVIYSAAFALQVLFYLIPVQIPFHLKELVGATPGQSGLAIAAGLLCGGAASLLYGRINKRMSFARVLALNFGLLGAGYLVIGFAADYAQTVAGLIVACVGMGLMMPNLAVWLSAEMEPSSRGRAVGGLGSFMFLGQFISPLVGQPLSAAFGSGRAYTVCGLAAISLLFPYLLLGGGPDARAGGARDASSAAA